MKKNLIAFLFGESQIDDEIAGIVEAIADLDTDGAGDLKVAKKPLSAALSALGIEDSNLENDPRGLSMVFTNAEDYRAAHAILNEPDSLHKLAELGWVFSTQGDVAMANEPAELRIRFLEIDNIEPQDAKATYSASDKTRLNKAKEIIKQGREFATTAPDFDDSECNPVDHSEPKKGSRDKGVSKAKDGADPEGKPKGSDGGAANKSGAAPRKGDLTQPEEGTAPKAVKENAVLHAEGCGCADCKEARIAGDVRNEPWAEQMATAREAVRPEVERRYKPLDRTAAALRRLGVGESVTCQKCRKGFDYGSVPECSMGAVKCPSCGTTVDQSGRVLSEGGKSVKCPGCGKRHSYGTTWCPCGKDICDSPKDEKSDSEAIEPQKRIGEGSQSTRRKDNEGDDGNADHKHVYGKVEHARLTGNPHRKCTVPGCKHVTLDLDLEEGGHKSGCPCTFCTKYKGKGFGKKSEKPEGGLDGDGDETDESSAAQIVNSMLEANPGTPPGIMGHKSFNTLKLPGGNKDRKFRPARGMVQAAPEGSVVAKQTKPNRSA